MTRSGVPSEKPLEYYVFDPQGNFLPEEEIARRFLEGTEYQDVPNVVHRFLFVLAGEKAISNFRPYTVGIIAKQADIPLTGVRRWERPSRAAMFEALVSTELHLYAMQDMIFGFSGRLL